MAEPERDEMEIGAPRERSWWALTAWVLVYLIVGGVLIALFIRFAGSVAWAVGLVVFMIAYMTIMGRLASGNIDRRE